MVGDFVVDCLLLFPSFHFSCSSLYSLPRCSSSSQDEDLQGCSFFSSFPPPSPPYCLCLSLCFLHLHLLLLLLLLILPLYIWLDSQTLKQAGLELFLTSFPDLWQKYFSSPSLSPPPFSPFFPFPFLSFLFLFFPYLSFPLLLLWCPRIGSRRFVRMLSGPFPLALAGNCVQGCYAPVDQTAK